MHWQDSSIQRFDDFNASPIIVPRKSTVAFSVWRFRNRFSSSFPSIKDDDGRGRCSNFLCDARVFINATRGIMLGFLSR